MAINKYFEVFKNLSFNSVSATAVAATTAAAEGVQLQIMTAGEEIKI